MKLYDVIRKEQLEEGNLRKDFEAEDIKDLPEPRPRVRTGRRISFKKVGILAGAIFVIVLIYVVGIKLVHAKVTITQRRIPFSLDHAKLELVREKDAMHDRLAFQAMVVTTEVKREVYGSEVMPSMTKAKGQIAFFNEYSKGSQAVKSGTTVTASTGKRYVTQQSVSVPGYTMNGKLKVPGTSTAVAIIAADVGSTYNSEGTTFTVSGWSGTQAKQFYGRSVGAISGGETGAMHTISDADRPDVLATLQAQLIERLKRETRAQIPENLITFPDLQFISIDSNSLDLTGQSIKFTAALKGTMVSYLISRDLLENAIANRALSDHHYTDVSIPALGDILVEPVSAISTNPSVIPDVIEVEVSGQGEIIPTVPVDIIKESLVGVSRRLFSSALEAIPEIDHARYALYPFWAPYFPATEKSITVKVN